MNKKQLCKARKDIQKVLDKLEIQAVSDPEDNNKFFAADVDTADANGMMINVCLYVTLKDKNKIVTLEMELEDKIDEDKIVPVLELVNLINRQAIVGHLFVHLRYRTVFCKKDIILDNCRLNKAELERSINHLLADLAFYSLDIREIFDSDETLDESSKKHWVGSSYLHKECRSAEQGTTITRGIDLEQ